MSQVLSMANEEELKMWNELTLGYTESQGEDEETGSAQYFITVKHDFCSVVQLGLDHRACITHSGMDLLREEVAKTLYPNCTKEDVIIGAPQASK